MATTIFRFKTSPLTAAVFVGAVALTLLLPAARASSPFLSNGEVQALTGKSIAEWGAEWWQWAFENSEGSLIRRGNLDRWVMWAVRCSLPKVLVASL